jgi:hypothetical protein
MRVDRDVIVVITTHAPHWLHHAGDLESSDCWFAHGKKQALDLRGQIHILKKVVTLALDRFGKHFPLFDIPLDEVNDKDEAHHRGEMVEDSKSEVDIPRGAKVMDEDTNRDEAIADLPAQKHRAYAKREDVEVEKRNRDDAMVCICDGGHRPKD